MANKVTVLREQAWGEFDKLQVGQIFQYAASAPLLMKVVVEGRPEGRWVCVLESGFVCTLVDAGRTAYPITGAVTIAPKE